MLAETGDVRTVGFDCEAELSFLTRPRILSVKSGFLPGKPGVDFALNLNGRAARRKNRQFDQWPQTSIVQTNIE